MHHHHQHDHVEEFHEKNSNLLTAKVVSMAVLGIASFIVGVLPLKLTKMVNIKTADKDNNLVISLLLCFGGGVLLFTTFLHLQPEVRESLAHLEAENRIPIIGPGIPVSELIFCLGFFFVYLIEEIAHLILHKKMDRSAPLHRSLSVKCKKENMTIPRVSLNKLEGSNVSYISNSTKELFNSQTNLSHSSSSHNGHSHIHVESSMKNSFRGLLAVLALSFHAVFEGLAVGLENDVQKVWYLFAAIATHKLVIAFCVGVELAVSHTKAVLLIIYIGTFALVSPLGIGVGIALSESGDGTEEGVVSVILQGMAAGTLLYVVFFEVLARERSNQHSGIWQLVAIIAGFGIMFGLQFVTGHDHSHGDSHSDKGQLLTLSNV
ncbi:zinc transporter ZIP1-like isoform X1 [Photinus pyralis]|uniref:zinc transporter ZIP1-like isoform X1 n=1 Tax=Photinus pyralis TaxID=7054 RepID=UPI0012675709|nr:zinc transporter ZIP1-like isoform X1 [Photinus pyralis]